MTRDDHNSAFGLFNLLRWLTLPFILLTALLYAGSWNQLPERMATHFGASGQPNGWMARQDALIFGLLLTAIVTGSGLAVLARVRKPDFLAWSVLGLFYFVLGTVLWGNNSVIAYNITGRSIDPTPVLIFAACLVVFVVIVGLSTQRGNVISAGSPFAEETHASHAFAFVMALPCAAFALLAAKIPAPVPRIALTAASVVMFGAVVLAWSGFRYFFSKSGLEIRTLGFRLRSIPAADIRSYAVERWNVLGGYGIRGIGDRRAYVWGNNGVRIQTAEGEIFLGHSEPKRIVRDLDRITGTVAGKQVLN